MREACGRCHRCKRRDTYAFPRLCREVSKAGFLQEVTPELIGMSRN